MEPPRIADDSRPHVGRCFGAGVAGVINAVAPNGVSYAFGIGFFGPVGADDANVGRSAPFWAFGWDE